MGGGFVGWLLGFVAGDYCDGCFGVGCLGCLVFPGWVFCVVGWVFCFVVLVLDGCLWVGVWLWWMFFMVCLIGGVGWFVWLFVWGVWVCVGQVVVFSCCFLFGWWLVVWGICLWVV